MDILANMTIEERLIFEADKLQAHLWTLRNDCLHCRNLRRALRIMRTIKRAEQRLERRMGRK